MGLIDAWIKAHKNVASPEAHEKARMRAQVHLERAYAVLSDSVVAARSGVDEERFDLGRELKRWLLVGRAETRLARAVRAVFYVFLATTLFVVGTMTAFTVNRSEVVGDVLSWLAFMAPLTWLLRAWAAKLARSRSASG